MQSDSRLHSVSDDLLCESRLSSSCVQQDSKLNLVLDEFLLDSRFSSSCVLPDARLDSVFDEFSRDSKRFSSCVQLQLVWTLILIGVLILRLPVRARPN